MKIPTIKDIDLKGKTVFLRADLNVPLKDGKIAEDYKLNAILPTIDYLLDKKAKIFLATHLGRPDLEGKDFNYTESLSTKILMSWFQDKKYDLFFEPNPLKPSDEKKEGNPIVLLENLRFYKGEKEGDPLFAEKLKTLAEIYVNDAFALVHRNDASITLLPQIFDNDKKAFGFLGEKEIKNLSKLEEEPKQTFVLICGGNKVKDKIPLLEALIFKAEKSRPKSIIIGGAMAYTFLQVIGKNIGKSLFEEESVEASKKILLNATKNNIKILLPIDHLVTFDSLDKEDFKTQICSSPSIFNDAIGVDIGPQTISLFSDEIKKAKTIFANGTMGIYTNPKCEKGSREIMKAIAEAEAFSVVGGGDAIAAIMKFDLKDKISYLSTGGGATLKFLSLSGDELQRMPGLKNILS